MSVAHKHVILGNQEPRKLNLWNQALAELRKVGFLGRRHSLRPSLIGLPLGELFRTLPLAGLIRSTGADIILCRFVREEVFLHLDRKLGKSFPYHILAFSHCFQ
jgi:hypothetical protein